MHIFVPFVANPSIALLGYRIFLDTIMTDICVYSEVVNTQFKSDSQCEAFSLLGGVQWSQYCVAQDLSRRY